MANSFFHRVGTAASDGSANGRDRNGRGRGRVSDAARVAHPHASPSSRSFALLQLGATDSPATTTTAVVLDAQIVKDRVSNRSKGVGYVELKDDIKDVFEPFGELEFATLQEEAGRRKSYGFVQYHDPAQAKEALDKMNGFELAGRAIRVGLGNDKFTHESTQQLLRPQGPFFTGSSFSGGTTHSNGVLCHRLCVGNIDCGCSRRKVGGKVRRWSGWCHLLYALVDSSQSAYRHIDDQRPLRKPETNRRNYRA